jgi:hypothetical protein
MVVQVSHVYVNIDWDGVIHSLWNHSKDSRRTLGSAVLY